MYVCEKLMNNVCISWIALEDSGFKLSYVQIGAFILSLTFIYAAVFAIKVVKRSFF